MCVCVFVCVCKPMCVQPNPLCRLLDVDVVGVFLVVFLVSYPNMNYETHSVGQARGLYDM